MRPPAAAVIQRFRPPRHPELPFMSRILLLGALLAVLLALAPADAQNAADLKPAAYAIRDARVVVEPGNILPKATVVIRDGLVTAVGPDVPIPPDAAVTDGKGLTVYPG